MSMDNNRNGAPFNNGMTQRVPVQNTPGSNNPQRKKSKKWYMSRTEKITLISLGSITILLLIIAIGAFVWSSGSTQDDGKILKGVVAAGVPLGDKTKEEAKAALKEIAAQYSQSDMVVSVRHETIHLSPSNTGAKLDIDAVVEAAYQYGRSGSRSEREQAKQNALERGAAISITNYLNLNTAYIMDQINELGTKFDDILKQPTLKITGTRPPVDNITDPNTDTITPQQTLIADIGHAEYEFNAQKLYEQVLESYNTGVLIVEGSCPMKEKPDSYEEMLRQIYDEVYVAPVAAGNESGYLTSGKYGYGFSLSEAFERLSKLNYGDDPIEIHLYYLAPDSNQDFSYVLGEDSVQLSTDEADTNRNTNIQIACQILNGKIIFPNSTFSFRDALGELTTDRNFVEAPDYLDRVIVPMVGGGVNQVAGSLFISALEARLQIVERHTYAYAPAATEQIGRDAYVDSRKDLKILNNTDKPVCIRAEVVDGELRVSIEGATEPVYNTEVSVIDIKEVAPGELKQEVAPEYYDQYEDKVIVPGQCGYTFAYRLLLLYKDGDNAGEEYNNEFLKVEDCEYEAKDAVVIVKMLVSSDSEV